MKVSENALGVIIRDRGVPKAIHRVKLPWGASRWGWLAETQTIRFKVWFYQKISEKYLKNNEGCWSVPLEYHNLHIFIIKLGVQRLGV